MKIVTLEEAQANLGELIASLHFGEDLVITRDSREIARLSGSQIPPDARPIFGRGKGKIRVITEETHMEDFADYLP